MRNSIFGREETERQKTIKSRNNRSEIIQEEKDDMKETEQEGKEKEGK